MHKIGNIHRLYHFLINFATQRYEEARAGISRFIHAHHANEIVFTRGATEGLNLVASTYGEMVLREGDIVLVSEMEHHSNLVPWQALCKRKNAELKIIPFLDSGELDLETYAQMLSDRVRIVSVAHVSNALGTVHPVKKITDLAHSCGAAVVIDGTQAVQHMQIDVAALDCDFYCFSGHKMYGPIGIGVLYGKQEHLAEMPPYQYGGEMVDKVGLYDATFENAPLRFEAGTPNYIGAIALHEAVRYIERIGIEQIAAHEKSLLEYTLQHLRKIPGVHVLGGQAPMAGLVSFRVDDIHAYDLAVLLDKLGIAIRSGSHCAQTVMAHYGIEGTARLSLACYNTCSEIDAFCESMPRICNRLQKVR